MSLVEEQMKEVGEAVVQTCRDEHGRHIPVSLAAFVVRAISLASERAFDLAQKLPGAARHRLVQQAVKRLLQDDTSLDTLKMQVAFEAMYMSETRKLLMRQHKREADNQHALDQIVLHSVALQDKQQVADLYRLIFKLLLANAWVAKVDRTVEREVARVVETVFPQVGLNAYRLSTSEQKRAQLREVIDVVLGIRLFNREIQKGGAGFEDVPALASKELDAMYAELDAENQQISDLCEQYAAVINVEFDYPESIAASLSALQDELTNRRQYLLHVHTLQHEVVEAIDNIKLLVSHFDAQLQELRQLVGSRSTVPKEQVYPKFLALARDWKLMVELRKKNDVRRGILAMLRDGFRNQFESSLIEADLRLCEEKEPKPDDRTVDDVDAHILTIEGNVEIEDENSGDNNKKQQQQQQQQQQDQDETKEQLGGVDEIVRVVKEKSPNFLHLPLACQGYCPWTIVHRGGVLLPGDPNLGILRYRGRFYNFVSFHAMLEFAADPERYVQGVVEIAKRRSELIYLLHLHDRIPHSSVSELLERSPALQESHAGGGAQTMVDRAVQTETHAVESHIDPNYEWNEWNLRRQALQYANITNKKTHSAQTVQSHFRRENETQTYKPKPNDDGTMPGKGTQTGVTKGTNVARTKKYIQGLRGKPGTQAHTVEFTHEPTVTHGSNPPLNNKQ